MSNFNSTERKIAQFLSSNKELKESVKYYYQRLQRLIYNKDEVTNFDFNVKRISNSKQNCFYGYYDTIPENENGNDILYHRLLDSGDEVEICVYNMKEDRHESISTSRAFNFQFGSRLQWIDNHKLIFNSYDSVKDQYGSELYNILSGKSIHFENPVLLFKNEIIYSIDFKHLNSLKSEYGYSAHQSTCKNKFPSFGILALSTVTGFQKEIVSIAEIIMKSGVTFNPNSVHFLNHFLISPNGKFGVFLHRWQYSEGRFEHCWLIDLSTNQLELLNMEMTSHYCWISNSELIAFITKSGVTGYFSIDIHKKTFTPMVGMNKIGSGDGHPSFAAGTIVFDSYPDRKGMQSLFRLVQNEITLLGKFYSPLHKNPFFRTDLHPRISKDGHRIYFDSNHESFRGLYCMTI